MSLQVAPDDIVRTRAEGAANEREPLLVLDPLVAFLDDGGSVQNWHAEQHPNGSSRN